MFVAQSCLTLSDPMDCSLQAPLSIGFSRQEYWSGLPFSSPGDLPDAGIELRSPTLQTIITWTFKISEIEVEFKKIHFFLGQIVTLIFSIYLCEPHYAKPFCHSWDKSTPLDHNLLILIHHFID